MEEKSPRYPTLVVPASLLTDAEHFAARAFEIRVAGDLHTALEGSLGARAVLLKVMPLDGTTGARCASPEDATVAVLLSQVVRSGLKNPARALIGDAHGLARRLEAEGAATQLGCKALGFGD